MVRLLTLALVLTSATVSYGAPLTVVDVQRLILKVGATQAVAQIFASEDNSNTVLRGITSGSDVWLRVAVQLAPGLDAHPGEAVSSALGAALTRKPARVFLIALPTFSIEDICAAPDVDDYEHLAPALAELRARQRSVKALTEQKLAHERAECLSDLAAAEKPLRAFFANP